jgi:hypothetical protein
MTREIILTVALEMATGVPRPFTRTTLNRVRRAAVRARHLKENRGGGGRAISSKLFSS